MKDLLTPRELAELCGVSPDTVRSWCFRKQITYATTPGGHKRFRREDVIEFLKARGFPIPQSDKISPVRILVVDDDEAFRKSLVGALQKEPSFNVKEAADGYEAGRLLGQFDPDVLVIDLVMPGIDGFKICEDIRASEETERTRIIAVTGYPDEEMFQRARKSGADQCLSKPLEIETLKSLISGKDASPAAYKGRGRRPKNRNS